MSTLRSEETSASRIISWNTTKTAEGYAYRVYQVVPRTEPNAEGQYADTVTLRTGTRATRAQAKGRAQQWCRYLKGRRMSATYRNPWRKPNGANGPEFFETTATPFEHAGCLIYERIPGVCWDVVRDGVCLTQRAGRNGAKEGAELAKANGYCPAVGEAWVEREA